MTSKTDVDIGKTRKGTADVRGTFFVPQLEKERANSAFVMSLLLLQKRILTHKKTIESDDETVSILIDRRTSEAFEVVDADIDDEQIQLIQNELAEHLFSNQPILPEDETES